MAFFTIIYVITFFRSIRNNVFYIKLENLRKDQVFSSLFEISNKAPGTIEFFFGSISAALYLLLNVNLKSLRLIFLERYYPCIFFSFENDLNYCRKQNKALLFFNYIKVFEEHL